MQIFDVKPEKIMVNPKKCPCCKRTIETNSMVYYGHSNYPNINGDCCSYICAYCVTTETGYISDCMCFEIL